MPEVMTSIPSQTCISKSCEKHGEHLRHKFCPYCGSPVEIINIRKSSHLNLHEFLLEEFKDEDLFTAVYPDDVDYIIAVPNRRDRQGGTYFHDDPRTEILILSEGLDHKPYMHVHDFEGEDWIKLEEALKKRNIKYKKLTGVLQWFS